MRIVLKVLAILVIVLGLLMILLGVFAALWGVYRSRLCSECTPQGVVLAQIGCIAFCLLYNWGNDELQRMQMR